MSYLKIIKRLKPKEIALVVIFLKSMILHVKVPVLSLKIYCTCPNSSFRFEDWTLAYILVSLDIKLLSFEIIMACMNFTISKVTIKEIGTKFLCKKCYRILFYFKKTLIKASRCPNFLSNWLRHFLQWGYVRKLNIRDLSDFF